MHKVLLSLLVGVLALTACGMPGDDGTEAPASPAPDGSVAPVRPIVGLESVGLGRATVSVEVNARAWGDDAGGLTYVLPWDEGATRVTLVRVGFDGEERWRHEVRLPVSGSVLHPRLSWDEGLGVVALWFSTNITSDTADVTGDIHWFDLDTGEGDVITPRRPDDRTAIRTWSRLVGYVTFPQGYGDSTSFTHLDPSRQERTSEWGELLRAGEQSWLGGAVAGQATFSVMSPETGELVLRHGLNVILNGGQRSTKWYPLAGGEHGVVSVRGSKLVVVGATGETLLDYDGACRVNGGEISGLGRQLWSGSLIVDVGTGEHHCLTAIGEANGRVMGMTGSGVALAKAGDVMVLSEPNYNTLVGSTLEADMWPRGEYLVVADEHEDATVVSVFPARDLRIN